MRAEVSIKTTGRSWYLEMAKHIAMLFMAELKRINYCRNIQSKRIVVKLLVLS